MGKNELKALAREFSDDYPILIQDYIPGLATDLYCDAFHLREARPFATFVGRKLLSHPPAMGQTTAAEPAAGGDLVQLATSFFVETSVSGPVSLEFKVDRNGHAWVMEPMVGRSDYWLDRCIANGVDLPLIEYRGQASQRIPQSSQEDRAIWLDAERDPKVLFRVTGLIGLRGSRSRSARFTFWSLTDPHPFLVACWWLVLRQLKRH